ncbi:hypothetical protein SAMD00023353_1300980 [Rosellinia necatrix]|uniref:Uncharacterized protein n=1 Tax=Rosellinia necatrix TaxID=77044 RepID=A0A1S8A6S3_ROSNE|nr:hypothetical protein SAMD00023353_1300980 [Rosellinia necatrix]
MTHLVILAVGLPPVEEAVDHPSYSPTGRLVKSEVNVRPPRRRYETRLQSPRRHVGKKPTWLDPEKCALAARPYLTPSYVWWPE